MIEPNFREGDKLLRTGLSLPHLGVHAGCVYEVDRCDSSETGALYLKGVPEPLEPASFRTADTPVSAPSR